MDGTIAYKPTREANSSPINLAAKRKKGRTGECGPSWYY